MFTSTETGKSSKKNYYAFTASSLLKNNSILFSEDNNKKKIEYKTVVDVNTYLDVIEQATDCTRPV